MRLQKIIYSEENDRIYPNLVPVGWVVCKRNKKLHRYVNCYKRYYSIEYFSIDPEIQSLKYKIRVHASILLLDSVQLVYSSAKTISALRLKYVCFGNDLFGNDVCELFLCSLKCHCQKIVDLVFVLVENNMQITLVMTSFTQWHANEL